MRDDRPSVTAQRAAVRRAEHQLFDNPRVFEDPLAPSIIGPEETTALGSAVQRYRRLRSKSRRAFIAARSRYSEDQLARAVERGDTQYVILGAGLDTFAYRNPHRGLRVFEVDHPATQKWKRERLQAAKISVPPSVIFTPIDFECQALDEGLKAVGFHFNEATFFSCLGVTQYLSQQTVLATIRLIRSMSPKNGVVFDYEVPRSSQSWFDRMVFDFRSGKVSRLGEPFRSSFEPEMLLRELLRLGFGEIEDLDPAQINARYFSGRTDGLFIRGSAGHLVSCHGSA